MSAVSLALVPALPLRHRFPATYRGLGLRARSGLVARVVTYPDERTRAAALRQRRAAR
jgi:hypothetical protein